MVQTFFQVNLKTLEDLKKIAEGLGIPFIIKKGKEHMVLSGHIAGTPVVYWYKE